MTRSTVARPSALAVSCALALGAGVLAAAAPAHASPASSSASPARAAAAILPLGSVNPAPSAALQRLRDLADALGEQGRSAYSAVYSNLFIDQTRNQVILYATDTTRAAALVRAAAKVHKSIDTGLVRIVRAAFSKQALDARIAQIMAGSATATAADLTIYSAAPAPDGSGIQLSVKPAAVARLRARMATTAVAGTIPVTVTAGAPLTAATWRWNDVYPLIGGDVIVGNAHGGGRGACTAGLAAENSAGRDYLLTADHCFVDGSVFGDGDAVGDYNHLNLGNYYGAAIGGYDLFDEELIDTGRYNGTGTNSDEADQPTDKWYAVTSDAYSYNGDGVCQDGARSYYTGHGVPCSAVVYNQDYTTNLTWRDQSVHTVRGVLGRSTSYISTEGDSGALVFVVTGASTRQARGQVSAGGTSGGYNLLFWTEAPDILNHYSLHLNPHT